MVGSRNQTKSKGKRRSNKQNSNTLDDSPADIVESSESRHNSNAQSLTKALLKTKNFDSLSDEQVENFLLHRLEEVYKDAHMRLISYGYQHNEALNAILTNGHACGDSDIVTNIVQNSLSYIKIGQVLDSATQDFGDLKIMVDYSLTGMVNLLCQFQPNLAKQQAMWCLFLSDFHLGVTGTKHFPFATNEGESKGTRDSSESRKDALQNNFGGDCRREPKSPKRFDLTPSLACQLKKNVAEYAIAYRANMKMSSEQPLAEKNSPSNKDPLQGFEWEESFMVDFYRQDDERPESEPVDPKIATISSLVDQIKEVKKQVKERKEWAQRTVIQAAEKLNSHVIELRKLRMGRGKIQQAEDHKLKIEEARVKLMEMEGALSEITCQADLVDASVKRLEGENAQIRAEMEAFKLNASESDKLCLEAGKKERKHLKKIMALEKQKNKLQEEIAEEKNKSLQLQQQLTCLQKAQEDIEVHHDHLM